MRRDAFSVRELVAFAQRVPAMLVLLAAMAVGPARVLAQDGCDQTYDSTFDLIQKVIFENRGCTSSFCHDAAAAGGLDLRADHSYDALLEKSALTVPGWLRIKPGRKDDSLLFVNLAARTLPDVWTAPLRGMPQGGLPAISFEELEALRLWIEHGAPRDGVVVGTGELLDACLPPAKPLEIAPLPPPAPGTGVQLHMPRWYLQPHSESEVCYASYYDFTGQVPEQYLNEDGTKLRFSRSELRQDPVSHHLIVNLYDGDAAPDSPAWGPFRCRGGEREGESCNPTALGACGVGAECASDPVRAIGCAGYGPPDSQLGLNAAGITVSQETASDNRFIEGVYEELPLKGTIVWNSHAFNLTDETAKLEGWVNFYFADQQDSPVVRIFGNPNGFVPFVTTLFKPFAPAFGTDEVCEFEELPPDAQLFELSSHMHKRGRRFRIFDGKFACESGPNDGQPCSPYGPDLASPDLCAGAPCTAIARRPVGDCDGDERVAVDELVRGLQIALGREPTASCPRADGDGDGSASIDELVNAVGGALNGMGERDPDAALMYTNLLYDDPLVLRFEPPMAMTAPEAFPEDRTLTYCALYDNGFTDPSTVKRRSTSPVPPLPIGGPCAQPVGCVSGRVGEPCNGIGDDASCDSSPGAGDGLCDACPLRGGVTTEDEMFLVLGAYFVP